MLYIEDLKSAFRTKQSIEQAEKCIKELKKSREETISERHAKSISAEIEMIELKISILYGNIHKTVEFIKNCDDALVGEAMHYRFLLGKSWTSVACAMGGYNSPDATRKMVERYLEKKGVTKRVGEV